MRDPIAPFIRRQGVLILDGGLATELEARGFDLSDALWSARLLHDAPEQIKQIHLDYLRAGADCIISASYQATISGFMSQGFDERQARALLERSVNLAREARDEFWSKRLNRQNRLRPLVAAGIGPYGAYLADGSEYRGDYGLDQDQLLSFHRSRWRLLAACSPDLMACETIPSAVEARALVQLIQEDATTPAWISFSCRDGAHINDGAPLVDIVAEVQGAEALVALGINCTAPRYIPQLVREARRATRKPVLVYPNSGERYDSTARTWLGQSIPADFADQSRAWRDAGATLIGGCCRTRPAHVAEIRRIQTLSTKH